MVTCLVCGEPATDYSNYCRKHGYHAHLWDERMMREHMATMPKLWRLWSWLVDGVTVADEYHRART